VLIHSFIQYVLNVTEHLPHSVLGSRDRMNNSYSHEPYILTIHYLTSIQHSNSTYIINCNCNKGYKEKYKGL